MLTDRIRRAFLSLSFLELPLSYLKFRFLLYSWKVSANTNSIYYSDDLGIWARLGWQLRLKSVSVKPCRRNIVKMWPFHTQCTSKARLDGKTVIITGANSGIGKETARDLYRRGNFALVKNKNWWLTIH